MRPYIDNTTSTLATCIQLADNKEDVSELQKPVFESPPIDARIVHPAHGAAWGSDP